MNETYKTLTDAFGIRATEFQEATQIAIEYLCHEIDDLKAQIANMQKETFEKDK